MQFTTAIAFAIVQAFALVPGLTTAQDNCLNVGLCCTDLDVGLGLPSKLIKPSSGDEGSHTDSFNSVGPCTVTNATGLPACLDDLVPLCCDIGLPLVPLACNLLGSIGL
ncbi:hypothetical protein NMY22_g1882 [Coprinellus aureogranulatus]|nr:hypothetical protein NMY22_g1882 [Coprinellus aureogranulatus]